ncbi:hypothetical protein [Eubacterium oxidoreducens]|uniref:Uncharacterized protein n=1 Tax=Eubacterium oxidoreducens TaxID=1732 RepID=A0A1G6B3Z2_EUBOX|nr:hypothetical protein [Eubacterium oxidoreducens]SDB15381.1 hypothetical protein SAMN02910417_01145 [Eubacterium oxidoreducens]
MKQIFREYGLAIIVAILFVAILAITIGTGYLNNIGNTAVESGGKTATNYTSYQDSEATRVASSLTKPTIENNSPRVSSGEWKVSDLVKKVAKITDSNGEVVSSYSISVALSKSEISAEGLYVLYIKDSTGENLVESADTITLKKGKIYTIKMYYIDSNNKSTETYFRFISS